jgi:uncharacterized protein (TIGR01244 family)
MNMRQMNPGFTLLAAAATLLAAVTVEFAGSTATAQPAVAEVPAGNRVSPALSNYSRVTPQVAAGGLLRDGAVGELKSLGFSAIIDLRGPEEGIEAERQAAAAAGVRYFNVPVTTDVPTDAQIVEFARLVESAENHPVMVHCGSANRVGAMWALYRAAKGTPIPAAIAEGRAIGLQPAREIAVQRRLAQPPFTK